MPPAEGPSKKRKQPPQSSSSSQKSTQKSAHHTKDAPRKKRRPNAYDARSIAAQTTAQAYGIGPAPQKQDSGQINVDKFVRAREFEIKALEQGIKNSKRALNQRAFQNVPKDLRRRTASHDVKRTPKRLRAKAKREMMEDNTPAPANRRKKKRRERAARAWVRADTRETIQKLFGKKRTKVQMEKMAARKQARRGGAAADGDVEMAETGAEQDAQMKDGQQRKPKKRNGLLNGVLQTPPVVKAKFRKRQVHKSWLPTHLFHAKRARMPLPKEPLWRMAIPLSPSAKSYRPTHRASRTRGAVAWDMSYMSTIGLTGKSTAILHVLRQMSASAAQDASANTIKTKKWLAGTRFWSGWIFADEGSDPIAPVEIIWDADVKDKGSDKNVTGENGNGSARNHDPIRRIFVRIHPSAFLQAWERLLQLCRREQPAVRIEDLRFEIGSIEVTGPAAAEAIVGSLRPLDTAPGPNSAEKIWSRLAAVTDASSMPASALLGIDVADPRLHHPPRKQEQSQAQAQQSRELLETLATWPVDKTQARSGLFDAKRRWSAGRDLPSQKAINRRRALAEPGKYPDAQPGDPRIPVLLLAKREGHGSAGTWVLLLPWKCVQPVWYSLMYYPLLTGGNVRFGGLDEKRQVAFEAGLAWFPGDFAGTAAGAAWEQRQRLQRLGAWERKPKGKRVEYDSADLGRGRRGEVGLGWACDWQYLVSGQSNDAPEGARLPDVRHLCPEALPAWLRTGVPDATKATGTLTTVRIRLLTRGVPNTCARVYRLPREDAQLRSQWLQLMGKAEAGDLKAQRPRATAQLAEHERRRALAASLLEPPLPRIGDAEYPDVPGSSELIGFVTTGNFNLGEGGGTGMACILLAKVVEQRQEGGADPHQRICIVREAGQRTGRLAQWEPISMA